MSWDTPKDLKDVTVKQLTELCSEYKTLKSDKKNKDEESGKIHKEMVAVQAKILEYLDEYGMTNFSGEFGLISRKKNYGVKQPTTPENQKLFYDYLKEKDLFDSMVSINSNTLKSYVKQEILASDDKDFVPPGIEPPNIHMTISLTKG